jgi:hypothetical protein
MYMHHVVKFRREMARQLRPLFPIIGLFALLSLAHALGF